MGKKLRYILIGIICVAIVSGATVLGSIMFSFHQNLPPPTKFSVYSKGTEIESGDDLTDMGLWIWDTLELRWRLPLIIVNEGSQPIVMSISVTGLKNGWIFSSDPGGDINIGVDGVASATLYLVNPEPVNETGDFTVIFHIPPSYSSWESV